MTHKTWAAGTIVDSSWLQDVDNYAYINVNNITALKALLKTGYSKVNVMGYTNAGDGGGGTYYYDSTDTTSSDNGGTIIVATDGGRWKRLSHSSSHGVDYAIVGTTDIVTNPLLTGSPATGWTIANFTSNNPGATHTAGTIGTLSRSATITAYAMLQISVTLTTTTEGGVAFTIDGNQIPDTSTVSTIPVGSSVVYTFSWLPSTSGSVTISFLTDNVWAGKVEAFHIYTVQQTLPLDFTVQATDDRTLQIPQGIKFGRFNAGNVLMGDIWTGALLGSGSAWNVHIGARSGGSGVSTIECTSVGSFSLQNNQADRSVAFGYGALKGNTTGIQNTGLGYKSFGTCSTGHDNHGVGFHSGLQVTTGSFMNAHGTQALYNATSDTYHVAMGHQAGISTRGGIANTYIGALAGVLHASNTYAYNYGTMIGEETKVYGNSGVALGSLAVVGVDGSPVNNAMALGAGSATKIANTAKIGNALTDVSISGKIFSRQVFGSDSTGAGVTLSVANFVAATLLTRSGPGGIFSDTTPTAAAIVAAIPGCEVGTGYDLYVKNTTAFTMTLVAGSGITLSGTTTVTATQTRLYKIQVTNIGAGTEAATVVGVSTSAN